MAENLIRLDIVTPAGLLMSENVAALNLPASMGSMGVLKNHAPLMTSLDIGIVKYIKDDKAHFLAVHGGFAEVKENVVIILADSAEKSGDIDVARAMAAQKRAEERLKQREADLDVLRAEMALRRAIIRIKVSQMS
ncbi:MAG: F0F1 ATP synthase subunit epsilon [Firmicutes bacterium]|nr:F0F1 ATP synthase subunit epsilon [Bacillota bacterium]MBQ3198746.1 F0F1 ATP synthase subunit epsilon [Bacillota bacterium]